MGKQEYFLTPVTLDVDKLLLRIIPVFHEDCLQLITEPVEHTV